MQFDRSPAEVWRRYERDRDYKRSIGLYDRVRRNEAFYLGRQWEGLRVQSLDPLIFNVLRRCVNLFVAMLVSDDVAVRVTPFEMNGEGRRTAHVLERAFAGQDMRLQVDVGAASYWSEIMQTTTSDHLLESGVISDPLVYLENVPDYQVRGKHDLLHALRMQRQTQKEETANAGTEQP